MRHDRRAFTGGTFAFLLWPRAVGAQPAVKVSRVGFLSGPRFDRNPELAAELVRRNADVIADDPVSVGYVAILARPGGRMTGLTTLNVDLDAKRLEILSTALPGVTRVGVLSTPHDRAHDERLAATERAAQSMRVACASAP